MVASKAKRALPVILGMLDAVLIAAAFVRGAPAWVYFVLLAAWWAGMPLYQRCFEDALVEDMSAPRLRVTPANDRVPLE